MTCDHYCNCELRCPTCIRRFWKWAESHTRGRIRRHGSRGDAGPPPEHVSFYVAAGKWRSP